jgi:hypothetical protein
VGVVSQELHSKYGEGLPRPRVKAVILYVDEHTSVERQLARGRAAIKACQISLDSGLLNDQTVRLHLRELGLTRGGSCAAVTLWMSAVGWGWGELGSCA